MTLHLDTLPVHPQPLPLESYTGYLTRLAEANGIRHLNQLSVVTGLHLAEVRSPSDFPHVGTYAQLPQVAACSMEHLQATTFYYLLRKFGRTTNAPHMSKHFLQESISSHLRYCPYCLQEHGFISLLWRFLGMEACPQHSVELLTECGHCGQPMPFLSNGLRVSHCPYCQGDLRICKTRRASETTMRRTQVWHDDLVFLLTPQGSDDCNVIQHIGPQLLWHRQQNQYSLEDVAAYLSVPIYTIQGMESQARARRGETFTHYVQYAQQLSLRLSYLFSQALQQSKQTDVDRWIVLDIREQALLDALQKTTLHLDDRYPSFNWFAEQMGTTSKRLAQYPTLVAYVRKLQSTYREQQENHDKQLLERTRQIAEQLALAGQPVTRGVLSEKAGVKIWWFTNRQEYVTLLRSYESQRQFCRKRQEQDLYNAVQQAIDTLQQRDERVTIKGLANLIGIHEASLRTQTYLTPLFVAAGIRHASLVEAKVQEERDLLQCLPAAEDQLATQNLPLTQKNVIEALGISASRAWSHPEIANYLYQLPVRRKQKRAELDLEYCQCLPPMLHTWEQMGQKITLNCIAEYLGCSRGMLRFYPQTWQLIADALAQQKAAQALYFQQREDDYLARIEDIVKKFREAKLPISVKEIYVHLGVARGSFRTYFRVRARLEQIAEDTRRQNR